VPAASRELLDGARYGLEMSISVTARAWPVLSVLRARMRTFPGRACPVVPRSGMLTVLDPQLNCMTGGAKLTALPLIWL